MQTKLEDILVNSHKAELVTYMRSHPQRFDELIKLVIADKQRISWRAAWLLWSCMEPNDQRIRKYLKRIIGIFPAKKDSEQRELLMVLQRMKLNNEQEGLVFDICTTVWQKTGNSPSLRCNAFKLMVSISKKHPGLSRETTQLATAAYVNPLSNTARRSIFKMLEELG
jgi:hypothetical protein